MKILTVQQSLDRISLEDVKEYLNLVGESSNIDKTYKDLKRYKYCNTSTRFNFYNIDEEGYNEGLYSVDIHNPTPNDFNFGLDFIPYRVIANMKIKTDGSHAELVKQVASIIWEIRFYAPTGRKLMWKDYKMFGAWNVITKYLWFDWCK